jgi:hypothetical protein
MKLTAERVVSRAGYVRPLALALGWRGSLQAQVSLMGWGSWKRGNAQRQGRRISARNRGGAFVIEY